MGKTHLAVDSGIMLFINHVSRELSLLFLVYLDAHKHTYIITLLQGCNGTSNYGCIEDEVYVVITEMNADAYNITEILSKGLVNLAPVYSPVFERNLMHALNSGDYAFRDIPKGEEIVTDYLKFAGSEGIFEDSAELKKVCSGEEVGDITRYESES